MVWEVLIDIEFSKAIFPVQSFDVESWFPVSAFISQSFPRKYGESCSDLIFLAS